jgi:hypothetical protein
MRTLLLFLCLFILTGCKDTPSASTPPETLAEALNTSEFTTVLAPLIDPAKLDTLKGKRAATQAYSDASRSPKCPMPPFQPTELNTSHPVAQDC